MITLKITRENVEITSRGNYSDDGGNRKQIRKRANIFIALDPDSP